MIRFWEEDNRLDRNDREHWEHKEWEIGMYEICRTIKSLRYWLDRMRLYYRYFKEY